MALRIRDFHDFSAQFAFRWSRFGRLAGYGVSSLVFETFAVIMLMPIMMFIERRGDTMVMRHESRAVDILFSTFESVGITPTFPNLLLIAFTAVVLRQVVTYVRLVESVRVQETLLRDVRHGLFARFNAAALEFQERIKIGEFVNTVVVEARRTVLAIMVFVELAVLALMLLVYVGMMIIISALLTAVVVLLIVLLGVGMRGLMQRTVAESRQVVTTNNDMLAFLNERLTAPRLIRLCGMAQAEADEFHGFVDRQVDTAIAMRQTTGIGEIIVEPAVVGTGFVLIFCAYQFLGMPLATISVFLFIMLRLLPLTKSLITLRQSILSGMGSLEIAQRVLRALDEAREQPGGRRPFDALHDEIHIENVSFSYPGTPRQALSNINLGLRRGTLTALVGPSGGGKSTLIDLLPRLRMPQSGRITIDDVPLEEFSVESLRKGISFAPQAPQIFDCTVAQHIRYGRADATESQINQAANLAGAASFIAALPNGYETRLGPAAVQLSGGQKQRIDLARVLASDAPLMIFDEPTSNLDNESESVFRHALRTLRQANDKTVVVIAHRLRLVDWADQIVVLNDGRIEAAGTHSEVYAASSWYRGAYLREVEMDPAVQKEMRKLIS